MPSISFSEDKTCDAFAKALVVLVGRRASVVDGCLNTTREGVFIQGVEDDCLIWAERPHTNGSAPTLIHALEAVEVPSGAEPGQVIFHS